MICWFKQARLSCRKRGYEVVIFETDEQYALLKKNESVRSITEDEINRWIIEDF